MKKTKHIVNIIESESGWGMRVDEVKKFDSHKDALDFCDKYNKRYNTEKSPPPWYMRAELGGTELVDVKPNYPIKLKYDGKNDLFYLKLTDQKINKQIVKDDIILDVDDEGNVVGVEILFLKKKLFKNEKTRSIQRKSSKSKRIV